MQTWSVFLTRMWMIKPSIMCRQHLLGEHKEIHQLVGSILHKKSIAGYVEKGLIEVHNAEKRHSELVREMEKRGYNHQSKLQKFKSFKAGKVDIRKSIADLKQRCKECGK